MKETGDISKSQTYGAMKKGICTICGDDVSKLSWKKQQKHAQKCLRKKDLDSKQTQLFP